VLDAEVVAIDRKSHQLLPFQELSKRKRKDVTSGDIQVPVCLFGFDLLFFNEEVGHISFLSPIRNITFAIQPILRKPFKERREILRAHFQPVEGEFQFAKSSDGETTEEIQAFLEESVKDGCEGLMIKMLTTEASYYEPSKRSVNWLKVCKSTKILFVGLNQYPAEEGLFIRYWRLFGSGRGRCVLRERQTNKCLWSFPTGLLRHRCRNLPNNMQNWYRIQR
jgi:hypothetical protein